MHQFFAFYFAFVSSSFNLGERSAIVAKSGITMKFMNPGYEVLMQVVVLSQRNEIGSF